MQRRLYGSKRMRGPRRTGKPLRASPPGIRYGETKRSFFWGNSCSGGTLRGSQLEGNRNWQSGRGRQPSALQVHGKDQDHAQSVELGRFTGCEEHTASARSQALVCMGTGTNSRRLVLGLNVLNETTVLRCRETYLYLFVIVATGVPCFFGDLVPIIKVVLSAVNFFGP